VQAGKNFFKSADGFGFRLFRIPVLFDKKGWDKNAGSSWPDSLSLSSSEILPRRDGDDILKVFVSLKNFLHAALPTISC
jgi:hypothetical protein